MHEQLFAPLAASGKALLELGWDSAGALPQRNLATLRRAQDGD